MKEPRLDDFISDEPLSDSRADTLNRAPFARRVANALRALPQGSSLVVGIHGQWGDGKTTVLRMIRAELEEAEHVVGIDFNPWRFTEESAMLCGFFQSLANGINKSLGSQSEEIGKILRKLAGVVGAIHEVAGQVIEAFAPGEATVEALRERLTAALLAAEKRIVIFVDDVDRLDKDEIYSVFRLVKATANFPNVSYVLAFDIDAVANALSDRFGGSGNTAGRAFLQKIIQVPLNLPIALRSDLLSMCLERLNFVLSANNIEPTEDDLSVFGVMFQKCVAPRLETPRAVKRYGNALMFAMPLLKEEVNLVDLLLIEAIRAFYPDIYSVIREHYAEFAGVTENIARLKPEFPGALASIRNLLEGLPELLRDAVKDALAYLFPRLAQFLGNTVYGPEWLSRWRDSRRICSPEYCDRYFTYAVGSDDIAASELAAILDQSSEGRLDEVKALLMQHLQRGRAKRLLDHLRARQMQIDLGAIETLCEAIASVAAYIPYMPSLLDIDSPRTHAAMFISVLVERVPMAANRVTLLRRVVAASEPLRFSAECLRWVTLASTKAASAPSALTEADVSLVRAKLVDRVRQLAGNGEPLFGGTNEGDQVLLFEWSRQEGREAVTNHLSTVFARDPNSLFEFLKSMAPRMWTGDRLLPRVGEFRPANLDNIDLLFPVKQLAVLVEKHLPGNLADPQLEHAPQVSVGIRLAEQFVLLARKREPPDAS